MRPSSAPASQPRRASARTSSWRRWRSTCAPSTPPTASACSTTTRGSARFGSTAPSPTSGESAPASHGGSSGAAFSTLRAYAPCRKNRSRGSSARTGCSYSTTRGVRNLARFPRPGTTNGTDIPSRTGRCSCATTASARCKRSSARWRSRRVWSSPRRGSPQRASASTSATRRRTSAITHGAADGRLS